jgi:hydroxymethylpyrimidine/phosphomethylpyrimidine kinase
MLASPAIIDAVAAAISDHKLGLLVVDPVMIAKSGAPLLKPAAIAVLKAKLLPLAAVVTPNLHEAGALTGREIKTLAQMKEAARAIRDLGPENVVVKGGHLKNIAADVLYDGREFTEFRAERIGTKNTHGTGCIFASAIAANLAHKKTVRESVTAAKDFITAAIRTSLAIGKGYGPANPMALLYQEPGVTR